MSQNKYVKKQSMNQTVKGNISAGRDVNFYAKQEMNENNPRITYEQKEDFLRELNDLEKTLSRLTHEHEDLKQAHTDLKKALQESQKAKPEPNIIKRFLLRAKGFLDGAALVVGSTVAIQKIAEGVGKLIERASIIFGG